MRQRGIGGIDVDGRNIQLESRMRLLEIEAADPFHVSDKRNQLKLNVDPVAPFAFAQHEFLVLHGEFGDRLQRIDGDRERLERRRRSLAKCVVGTDQLCGHLRIFHLDRDNLPAFNRASSGHRVVGVKGKCAVAAAQVGRAHAGQSVSLAP